MKVERMASLDINKETHPHLKYVILRWIVDDIYEVLYDEVGPINPWKHIRIRRKDDRPICDYMILQEIKNEIFGRKTWAIQVFPPQDEFRDGSNTYHLWTKDELDVPNLNEIYEYVLPKNPDLEFVMQEVQKGLVRQGYYVISQKTAVEACFTFNKFKARTAYPVVSEEDADYIYIGVTKGAVEEAKKYMNE